MPPPPQVEVQAKFDEEEIRRYSEPGTSGVKGQAFLRQQGGGIVTCAGSEVFLVPATPYYRQLLSTCGLAGILNWQLRLLKDIARKPAAMLRATLLLPIYGMALGSC